MTSKYKWLFALLSLLGFDSIYVAGGASVGRVVIGTPGNDASSLSFSNGTSQSEKWFFHVYVTVYNETGSAANLDNNDDSVPLVTISCNQTPTWGGYSSVEFSSVTIEAPNGSAPNFTVQPITVPINFTNLVVGRAVEVRCWGESVLEVVEVGENGTRENASIPQFTKDGSISPPVAFAIYRQGTVNICANRVIVPYSSNTEDNRGTFIIELSDPVEAETSVMITCTMEPYNTSDASDVIKLNIEYPVEIIEGHRGIEVVYERTNGSGSVLVACFGQSIRVIGNDTYNETQYTPETSQGAAVLFELDRGYVTIYPQSTKIRSSQMTLFLVLDAMVTTDVIFTCRVETVESLDDAVDIAEYPYCQSIVELVVERPFSNITNGGREQHSGETRAAELPTLSTVRNVPTPDKLVPAQLFRETLKASVGDETSLPMAAVTRRKRAVTMPSGTGSVSAVPVTRNTMRQTSQTGTSPESAEIGTNGVAISDVIVETTMAQATMASGTVADANTARTPVVQNTVIATTSQISATQTTMAQTTLTDNYVTQHTTLAQTTAAYAPIAQPTIKDMAQTTAEPTTMAQNTTAWTTAPEMTAAGTTVADATTGPITTTIPTTSGSTAEEFNPNMTTTAVFTTSTFQMLDNATTETPATTNGPTTESLCDFLKQTTVNETVMVETLVNGVLVNVTQQKLRVVSEPVTVPCSELYMTAAPKPPVTTPVPRNQTGEWHIRNPKLEFKVGGSRFAEIYLDRAKAVPAGGVQELVVVTCCTPSEQTINPKYKGKRTAALIVTTLTPNVYINITQATLPENEEKETPIKNPAYVEVAPCPCDLTKAACDINCCCDTDCSEAEKMMFTCAPGVVGGFPAPLPLYICDTGGGVGRTDWYPFICVHKENTAFLGYFFANVLGLRDEVAFKAKAQTVRPAYTYRETEERSKFNNARPYKSGYDIKTGHMVKITSTDKVFSRKSFVLSLPQPSLLGQCVNTAPLRFLHDIDNECMHTVKKDLCSAMSPLSASLYAQSTETTNPPCPRAPVIIRAGGTDLITMVKAHYLCSTDATPYLRSTAHYSDMYTSTVKSLFGTNIDTSECTYDPDTQVFRCAGDKPMPPMETSAPPRCTWDDGYTPPPTPVYNEANETCENAVLDVNYNFTWRGNELLVLNATYVLADLPLEVERIESYLFRYMPQLLREEESIRGDSGTTAVPTIPVSTAQPATSPIITDPTALTTETPNMDYNLDTFGGNLSLTIIKSPAVLGQKFKVAFWREFTLGNRTANDTSRQDRYQRSGKIGYVSDRPVISGVPVLNATDDSLSHVDTAVGLSLWSPVPGGLCAGADRAPVNFRENAISSCVLRLGLSDLYQGCDDLRRQILHHQDALMASSLISRNGDPDTTSLQHWIRILRENITAVIPPSETPTTTEAMTTQSMNYTTEENTTTSLPSVVPTTDNVTDSANDTTVRVDAETVGRCPNIPSGIHVDIMYAVAGAVNAQPVYEIVGAKVSYAMSTWSLSCGGPGSSACLGNESLAGNGNETVQSFSLTSSVNFHLVPSKEEPVMTRYHEQHTPRLYKCQGDACWEELAYPFMPGFQGDPIMYVRAVSLTSLIFIGAYFLVTRPWW